MNIFQKNVEGPRCEFCKSGHYNLDAQNSDGCTPCYCSGITSRCQPSDWGTKMVCIRFRYLILKVIFYFIAFIFFQLFEIIISILKK